MMKIIIPMMIISIFPPSMKIFFFMSILIMLMWISNFPFHIMLSSYNPLFFYDILSFSLSSLTIMSFILIIISSFSVNQIFFLISMISLLLIISFSSSNTILFYIFFESVLIPTIILISYKGKSMERLQAGIYLLLYTIFGSLPLLLGILWYNLTSNFIMINSLTFSFNFPIIFFLAFLIKFPMFFFHLWLPKAHVEAPLEGSMILAAILLKLGGYGIIRFASSIQFFNPIYKSILFSISLMGALFTSTNCIRQKDSKALIAYSSVAHMALTIVAIFSFKQIGLNSAILMMIAHGFTSSALFLLITMIYNFSHSRNILIFKSAIIIIPNLTFWWFMFSALNISAPPSFNMISEMLIFSSIIQIDMINIPIIFFSSIATASFSIILYANISHNPYPSSFPFSNSSKKNFLSIFMHFYPLIILSLKPELMTLMFMKSF